MAAKPHKDFRANPDRCIHVQGRIDQQLIERLAPRIIRLQNDSREPITVYIDSPGGITLHAEILLRLLQATDQNFSAACRLITVVTSRAASAAADLLCSGAYAIAFAGATIFFHGVRTLSDDPLTVEVASGISQSLRLSNDRYAMALADRSYWRLIFRYVFLRPKFEEYRNRNGKLIDLECFVGLISEKLSAQAMELIKQAKQRYERYETLVERVVARAGRFKGFKSPKRPADFEAAVLKGIIDFEVSINKEKSWNFSDKGLAQLSDDFILLREYLTNYESAQMLTQCRRWSSFFLSAADNTELETIPEDKREEWKIERIKPLIRPIWLFFVALCHALQEAEYELTALDAYWLGLIDEVVGAGDLATMRMMVEASSDPEPDAQQNAPTNPTETTEAASAPEDSEMKQPQPVK